MYTYSDVVEIGRAQDAIMAGKPCPIIDDANPYSSICADEFDE